jgi:hypothetical protein
MLADIEPSRRQQERGEKHSIDSGKYDIDPEE